LIINSAITSSDENFRISTAIPLGAETLVSTETLVTAAIF
jgi:hypothetical protein